MTTSWHSYPKVFGFVHRNLKELFNGNVIVEEKIDGSQFSFGVFAGQIKAKSHRKELDLENPDNLFAGAVATVKLLAPSLHDGWTYRGEVLAKPKHNTLAYDRVPNGNVIIFDINDGMESYLSYFAKHEECGRIGLECIPLIDALNTNPGLEAFGQYLERKSILGGQIIEGVVIKNYGQHGPDGKVLMGKYVSERFKEVHRADWKERNPNRADIIAKLIEQHRTPARWDKAIQHLREEGQIEDSPTDIGKIIKEIGRDTHEECIEDIKDALLAWAWPQIAKGLNAGFPQYYKDMLIEKQFANQQ